MNRRLLIGLLLLTLALAACGLQAAGPELAAMPTTRANFASDDQRGFTDGNIELEATQEALEPGQRVVLRSANLNITVEDTATRVDEITAMAAEFGGWVVSSNTSTTTGRTPDEQYVYGSVTIRVPAARFDEALARIHTLAVTVNTENIVGEDVTQDYVDTESRLRNLEAAEQQLQTIMENAQTVEEVLAVYDQLVQTRAEIEVARGRLQYYSEAAAYSSISISLQPFIEASSQVTLPDSWNPLVTAARAIEILVRLVQWLIDTLIVLLILGLPFVIIFGIPAWWVLRRRRQAKANIPAPASSESTN